MTKDLTTGKIMPILVNFTVPLVFWIFGAQFMIFGTAFLISIIFILDKTPQHKES